ncbi:hypothetical protein FV113G1_20300 [Fusobacterium varium]|nr:hypothetical protein FV113G1_20300 [Fusobacterium varium]
MRVIKIVDQYSVLIDAGKMDGIKKEDKIRIFNEGDEIFDLDGKSLGKIEILKDELQVEIVYDKFSLCQKIQTRQSGPIMSLNSYLSTKKEKIKIEVLDKDIESLAYSTDEPIKKGDLAKKIKE